jgi:hypothetical protein
MKEIELYRYSSNFILPFTMIELEEENEEAIDDMYEKYEKIIRENYFKEMKYWRVDFYENNYEIYLEPKLENWESIHMFMNENLNMYINELVNYLQKVCIIKGSNFMYMLTDKFSDNWEHYTLNIDINKSNIVVKISMSIYDDEFTYNFSR